MSLDPSSYFAVLNVQISSFCISVKYANIEYLTDGQWTSLLVLIFLSLWESWQALKCILGVKE